MNAQGEQSHLEKLIVLIKASPARSAVITGLMVILIIAWARVLVGGKTGPAAAQASPRGSVATPIGSASILPAGAASHHTSEMDDSLRDWAQQPIKPLARNPFSIPLDSYPRDGSKIASDAAGNGYWDVVRKSMSARADQQEQHQILVDNVRIAAGQLKLQSTIMGKTRGAVLNGQLVHEGSTLAGFQVLKIEPRQVIVEREGIKLALMMD